jgi:hypothetical protein
MPPSTPKYTSPACASCKCDLGAVVPFSVNDGDGGKYESFCPRCFVYVRAPKEPHRFYQGGFTAVSCAGCDKQSVAVGAVACGQCGSRSVVILPPALAV